MSQIDRQKRMTNVLLAGNLATNYRSTKILGEMRNLQSQQLQTDQKRNAYVASRLQNIKEGRVWIVRVLEDGQYSGTVRQSVRLQDRLRDIVVCSRPRQSVRW